VEPFKVADPRTASAVSATVIARNRGRVSHRQVRVPSHARVAEAAPTDAAAPIIHCMHVTASLRSPRSVPPLATRDRFR